MDEGRFGLQPVLARAWAKRGERSTQVIAPGYRNFYVYGAVSPFSGDCFSLLLPHANTECMQLWLNELALTNPDKRLLVFMDNAGWHHAESLVIPPGIQLEFLPAYSPELNPVERLWQWLKRHALQNRLFQSLQEVEEAVCKALQEILPQQLQSLCACGYF